MTTKSAAEHSTEATTETSADDTDLSAANAAWITPGAAARTASAQEADGNLVIVLEPGGRILSVVDRPRATDNRYPAELEGLGIDDIWPADIVRSIKDECRRVLRSRQVRSVQVGSASSHQHYEFICIAQGRDSVMLVARDISDTQQKISHLEKLAFEDPVTGLPNREWLLCEVSKTLERQSLVGGRSAVICLEFEQPELLEDLSSTTHRDQMLRDLAAKLKSSIRGANQQDEQDDERYSAVARVDFSRFAIFLPSIESGDDAASVTSRVIDLFAAPIATTRQGQGTKVAAGIALYPQDGSSADELFSNALTAMRDAKACPTQQQKFHSGTVRMRAIERQDLELALRSALEKDEFSLTWLPIVTSGTHEVVTAEALLRWPMPLFSAKPISEVVAVAEFTGLILPIGEWIFERACEQLALWHREGLHGLQAAVNVSAQEFSRANLVERTKRLIGLFDIDASSMTVEITERLLFRDSLDDFVVCRGLKELGVGISVDDYGTGACSFDHLSRSPVDSVKIHPNIVARSAEHGPSRAACAAVTAMAHALSIHVIAEGVETEDQALALREMGCDYLQGFLFSKPSDPEALAEFVRSGRGQ